MTYAARDAQVSIALFFHLLGLHSDTTPSPDSRSGYTQLANRCQGLVDTPFRERGGGEGEDGGKNLDGERRRKSRKLQQSTTESPETGDQEVPDPRRNKRKPLGVGYSARSVCPRIRDLFQSTNPWTGRFVTDLWKCPVFRVVI